MPRLALGIAAAALLALTACGTTPGTSAPQDSPTDTPTVAITAATPTADAPPDGTASPTPNGTASPNGTATASPNGTATATAQAPRELPTRVESFARVDQRTEDGVRIGTYRSDSLQSVVEVRLAPNRPARELISALGGTNPTQIGDALCSTQGDTICAQERDGVAALVASKQLPAGVVSNLTTKVLEAR